jgi:hypothetical protein
MLRYEMKSDTEIFITNDKDFNFIQDRDPATGNKFENKEEAVTWATEYAKEIGQTLIESEVKMTDEDLKDEITKLKAQIEGLKTRTNSTENAIMNLMDFSL